MRRRAWRPRPLCHRGNRPAREPTRSRAGRRFQELWLSYNQIAQLTGVEKLSRLRVLYVANNKIADYKALDVLTPLASLEARSPLGDMPSWRAALPPGERRRAEGAGAPPTPRPVRLGFWSTHGGGAARGAQELTLVGNPLYDAAKAECPPSQSGCTYRVEARHLRCHAGGWEGLVVRGAWRPAQTRSVPCRGRRIEALGAGVAPRLDRAWRAAAV